MTLPQTLVAVWRQTLVEKKDAVELEGETYPVVGTRKRKLRSVEFSYGEHRIVGIEQNPDTKSRWALLARQGKRVMQFSCEGRYIGNVVEGRLTRYGAWHGLALPD